MTHQELFDLVKALTPEPWFATVSYNLATYDTNKWTIVVTKNGGGGVVVNAESTEQAMHDLLKGLAEKVYPAKVVA